MNRTFQIFRQTSRTVSGRVYRSSHREFSILTRVGSCSPFFKLFSRRYNHQFVRHLLRRRQYSSQSEPTRTAPSSPDSPHPPRSFSERFKDLSRKYGWVAVGTYVGLSILDYPFFFLLVQSVGADRLGEYEHVTAQWIKKNVPFEIPQLPKVHWPWQGKEAEPHKSDQMSRIGGQGQESETHKNGNGEASKIIAMPCITMTDSHS